MVNFGSRLQEAMTESGMSQSELGRRLGTTSQSVNGWCLSGVIPRREILEKIPSVMGKPLYWFFMSDHEFENIVILPESKENYCIRYMDLLITFMRLSESDQASFLQKLLTTVIGSEVIP